ncbi:MAG: hypothetical protein J6Y01_07445, partial [Spirochaetales bacterium]|nr:hypothetical protein [Spirochaetales bacterium]
CSDDGKWTLWLLPIDKYGKEGNIHRLNLNVSSSEMPIVESIVADNTADGFKFGDIYAGNMEIITTLYAGSDKKNVSEVWYRAYTSQSEARANNDLTADIGSFDTEHQKGKWYIHKVTAGSRYTDRVKINNKNFIADGVTGQLIIEVKVYNNDKDESPVNILPIVVDHEKPSISIMTPVADSTIDGSVIVSGTLSDLGSEIENVYISYYDQTWTDGDINALTVTSFSGAIPNGNNPEVGKWYELGAINETSWLYTYKSSLLSDECNRTIVVAAVDKLKNIGVDKVDVFISRDSDRPVVTISNMKLSNTNGLKSPANYILNTQGRIMGSIYDDDGVAASVEYSTNGNSWQPLEMNSNRTSFTYDVSDDGPLSLYFRITDANGTSFESMPQGLPASKYSDSIKLRDAVNQFGEQSSFAAAAELADTVIYAKIDMQSPEISNIQYSTDGTNYVDVTDNENGIDKVRLGGTKYPDLYVKFKATDVNGIASARYGFGTGSLTPAANEGGDMYSALIDLRGRASGSYQLELDVADNAEKKVNHKYTVNIDNDPPNLTMAGTSSTVNKIITLSGTVSDALSGVDKVYVSYISSLEESGLAASFIPENISNGSEIVTGKWNEIKDGFGNAIDWSSTSNWSVKFNTEKITTSTASFLLAIAAVDKNGSVSFVSQSVTIDQDSDRPTVKLLAISLGANMSADHRASLSTDSI